MIEDTKILQILTQWNALWKKKFLPREKVQEIVAKVNKEVIDIVGVRRCGKSSLLALIIQKLGLKEEEILYVNFEDPAFINYYSVELLDKIFETYKMHINDKKKPYLFLDEIQLIPQWEKWVRKMRDLESAHIFVTGSSSKLLSREFGTSLTGRHLSHEVYPLSFKEMISFKGESIAKTKLGLIKRSLTYRRLFSEYLINGGFPEAVLTGQNQILKDYFEDILYKDIVLRHEIRDVNSLRKLATYFMTNIANPITYNSLRKQFSISLDLIRNYLSYMQEAYLVFSIPFFAYSLKKQEFAPKKVYCIDNGLRNAVSFKFSKDEGKLAENLVCVELLRKQKEIFYWKNKNEVDFVVKEKDNSLQAINVTYSDTIKEREIKGLLEFKIEFKGKVKQLTVLTKKH